MHVKTPLVSEVVERTTQEKDRRQRRSCGPTTTA
jgi:hypothetical protein